MLAVWTFEFTIQAFRFLMVHQLLSFHFLLTTLSTFHHVTMAVLSNVVLSCPQFSLPGATFLRVGALHLKVTKSSVVEVVWNGGEGHTVNRANLRLFNALSTE